MSRLNDDLFLDDVDHKVGFKGGNAGAGGNNSQRGRPKMVKKKQAQQLEMDIFDIEPSGLNEIDDEVDDEINDDHYDEEDEIGENILDDIELKKSSGLVRGGKVFRGRGRGIRRPRGIRGAFRSSYRGNYNDRRTSMASSPYNFVRKDGSKPTRRPTHWLGQQGESRSSRRNSSPDQSWRRRDSPDRDRRKYDSPKHERHSRESPLESKSNKEDTSKSDKIELQSQALKNKLLKQSGLNEKDMFNFNSLSTEESISLLQNVFTGESDAKPSFLEKKESTSGVLLPPQLQKQMLLGKLESAIQKNTLQAKAKLSEENKPKPFDMFSDDNDTGNKTFTENKTSSDKDKRSISPAKCKSGNEDNYRHNDRPSKKSKSRSPSSRKHRSRSRSRSKSRGRSPARRRSPPRNPSYSRGNRFGGNTYSQRRRSKSRSPERRRDNSPSYHPKYNYGPQGRRDRSPPSRRDRSPEGRRDRSSPVRRDRSPKGRRDRSPQGIRDYSPQGRRDRSPQGRRDHSPPGRRDHSPQGRRDHSPQDKRERSPVYRRSSPSRDQVSSKDSRRSPKWDRESRSNSPSGADGNHRPASDRWTNQISPDNRPKSPSTSQPASYNSTAASSWPHNSNDSQSQPSGSDFPLPHSEYTYQPPPTGNPVGVPQMQHLPPGPMPPFEHMSGPHMRMPMMMRGFRGRPGVPMPRMFMGPHRPPPAFRPPLPPMSMPPPHAFPRPNMPPENFYRPPVPPFSDPSGSNQRSWNAPEVPPPPGINYIDPSVKAHQGFAGSNDNNTNASAALSYVSVASPTVSATSVVDVIRTSHDANEPVTITLSPDQPPDSANDAKKDAIQMELKNQKLTLAKQRSEYEKKSNTLKRDLELLKQQKQELLSENLPDNDKFLKENSKLQGEIQNKLKAITNVIDMLNGIIGPDKDFKEELKSATRSAPTPPLPTEKSSSQPFSRDRSLTPSSTKEREFNYRKRSPSPRKHDFEVTQPEKKHRARSRSGSRSLTPPAAPVISESMPFKPVHQQAFSSTANINETSAPSTLKTEYNAQDVKPAPVSDASIQSKPQFNFVHYDPEIHWCRICNVFPRTAKDYLNHLHSVEHRTEIKERKTLDMPWHSAHPHAEVPVVPDAPTKRVPIRGLQFFIPSTAWYCKLCNIWIGDLHCASLHLKSDVHSRMYNNFTEQNPNWEVDWMSTRTRAYERSTEEKRRMKDSGHSNTQSVLSSRDKLRSGDSRAGNKSTRSHDSSSASHSSLKQSGKDEAAKRRVSGDSIKGKEEMLSISKQIMAVLNANKKSKKTKKSSKKHSNNSSSSSSSSTDSSSSSSDSEKKDLKKSIRVTMRKKNSKTTAEGKDEKTDKVTYVDLPVIKSKWDSPEKEVVNPTEHKEQTKEINKEDKLLKEWMGSAVNEKDKDIISNLKGRLKQKYEADREVERAKAEERRKEIRERRRVDETQKPSKPSEKDSKDDKTNQDKLKKPDKPSGGRQLWVPGMDDSDDESESVFEKTTLDTFKKKEVKKLQVINIPKKLPFIGRMPFMGRAPTGKRKSESEGAEPVSSTATESPMKDDKSPSDKGTDKKADESTSGTASAQQTGLPKSTLSLSKTPGLPRQLIKMKIPKMRLPDDAGVEDMDLDNSDDDYDDDTVQEKSGKLPKDFQEALNILFPADNLAESNEAQAANSNVSHTSEVLSNNATQGSAMQVMMQAPPPPVITHQDHVTNVPPGPPPPPIIGAMMDSQMSQVSPNLRPVPSMIIAPPPPIIGPQSCSQIPPDAAQHRPCILPVPPPRPCPPAGVPGPPPGTPLMIMNPHVPPPIIVPPPPAVNPVEPPECEDTVTYQKRKNPPSQKKRQQLKRMKQQLHKREQELLDKIEEVRQNQKNAEKDKAREELAMLGIDEDDMAAQSF